METAPDLSKHPLVRAADRFATAAHAGQVDKAGVDYIAHPRAVAQSLAPFGPHLVAAGLLHDVVEDCGVTADDLHRVGMPEDVITMVLAVSRVPGITYLDMIRGVAASPALLGEHESHALGLPIRPPTAALVKVADNGHNSRRDRQAALASDVSAGLARRYRRARDILLPAVGVEAAKIIYARINPDLLVDLT